LRAWRTLVSGRLGTAWRAGAGTERHVERVHGQRGAGLAGQYGPDRGGQPGHCPQRGPRDVPDRAAAAGGLLDGHGEVVERQVVRAQVSVEAIYKGFGGKPGLVRAIIEKGLAGRGPVPAEQRSDRIRDTEPDPRRILAAWGEFVAEIAPRTAPILLLARTPPRRTRSLPRSSRRSAPPAWSG
jgi:hypothetical protein